MAQLVMSAPLGDSVSSVTVEVPDSHMGCLRDLAAAAGVLYGVGLRAHWQAEGSLFLEAEHRDMLPLEEARDSLGNPTWDFAEWEAAQVSCAAEATLAWIRSRLAWIPEQFAGVIRALKRNRIADARRLAQDGWDVFHPVLPRGASDPEAE